jgi:hypothetical protein
VSAQPATAPQLGGKGSVDLFGRKVSFNALLVAGASLVGALYMVSRRRAAAAASAVAPSSVGAASVGSYAGDGTTLANYSSSQGLGIPTPTPAAPTPPAGPPVPAVAATPDTPGLRIRAVAGVAP